jgi:hypothetical protein
VKINNGWVVWLVAFLALLTRRLDQVLIPQFWAEDGKYFFAEGGPIWAPHASYLNLVPRAIALLLGWVPWEWAPLAYATTAAAITAGVAVRIWRAEIPRLAAVAGAVAVVAVHGSGEVYLNICCLHFILALIIVVGLLERQTTWWRAAGMIVAALSGPEVLILLPLSLIAAWRWRDGRGRTVLALLWAAALIQWATMAGSGRASYEHVWPYLRLARLYARVFAANWIALGPVGGWVLFGLLAGLIGFAGWRNRYLGTAMALGATGVLFLMAGRSVCADWATPFGYGARYAYVPFALVVWALGWLAAGASKPGRLAVGAVAALALASSASRWTGDVPRNLKWAAQVEQARAGTRTKFIVPPGSEEWGFAVPK